jgi:putative transposase
VNAFDVPRSTYASYRQRRLTVDVERTRLQARVETIHRASRGSAGARTICGMLNQSGESIGIFKVRRLMSEKKLVSKQPGPKRFKSANQPSDIAPNTLNREFTSKSPNHAWCGDVTYLWSGTQWLYLALIIDLFSRRIIGWGISGSPDTALTKKALTTAYYSRGKPKHVLFHSDQGCHYTSYEYQESLAGFKMTQSLSRRGNCWDNAPMERVFRTLKTEWVPDIGYESVEHAKTDVFAFIRYYNFMRGHSYNNYATPVEIEKAF